MKGSCLCGAIHYEIDPPLRLFQYCHCSRCRKFTGAAFAPNIYVAPGQFRWTKGEEFIGRYEQANAKYFATGFCKQCGSSMPWLVQGGKSIVVPAGTLDTEPDLKPVRNIFWDSRAPWFVDSCDITYCSTLPGKNNQ